MVHIHHPYPAGNFQKRLRDFGLFAINRTPVKCAKNFPNHAVCMCTKLSIYSKRTVKREGELRSFEDRAERPLGESSSVRTVTLTLKSSARSFARARARLRRGGSHRDVKVNTPLIEITKLPHPQKKKGNQNLTPYFLFNFLSSPPPLLFSSFAFILYLYLFFDSHASH